MGGTGLEPVTPSLSIRGSRSRQFAPVRLNRIVERDLEFERTAERTRANAIPCHPCHASKRSLADVRRLLQIRRVRGAEDAGLLLFGGDEHVEVVGSK